MNQALSNLPYSPSRTRTLARRAGTLALTVVAAAVLAGCAAFGDSTAPRP
jgi:hypothetical protein